ncbi:MAG TPA: sulfite oxidase-like oxidoreductase [Candidatus Angelobacter sp.]|nr:sulfite oxidase-like oxidoreductase [Candidatus Angelobacter sp.]
MEDDDLGLFSGNERKQKEKQMRDAGRLPPGQSLTLKWPVLHYGLVPRFDPATWDFRIWGEVEIPIRLTWHEFSLLPRVKTLSDFHCVTRWSRFDNTWEGVAFREVLKLVKLKPDASHVLVHAEQGYTANIPLTDLDRDDVLFATRHDGQPLSGDHGYPLRLIVPHLYAWKSVKWVRGLEFLSHAAAGFWEQNGYHIYGDPFKEQRFDTD